MTAKPDDDDKLRNVKDILRNLQQIGDAPLPAAGAADSGDSTKTALGDSAKAAPGDSTKTALGDSAKAAPEDSTKAVPADSAKAAPGDSAKVASGSNSKFVPWDSVKDDPWGSTSSKKEAAPERAANPLSSRSVIDRIVAKGESAVRNRNDLAEAKVLTEADVLPKADIPAKAPPPARTKSVADHAQKQARQKKLGALALATISFGAMVLLGGNLFFKYWPTSPPPRRAAPSIRGEAVRPAVRPSVPVKAAVSPPSAPPVAVAPAVAPINRPAVAPVSRPRARETMDCQAGTIAGNVMMDTTEAITSNARQLMGNGHIEAARNMLLQRPIATTQDGAWLLARSYDPNFLATIPSVDAKADTALAENWYRCWHDIGVRNGMVMNDRSLKRMIDAMH